MIENVTGVKVMAMHHNISTRTGEEVLLFTRARPPRTSVRVRTIAFAASLSKITPLEGSGRTDRDLPVKLSDD